MRRHIVIADDQPEVRSALGFWLEQQAPVCVVGEAVDSAGLLAILRSTTADVILLDWELPGQPGYELLRTVHASAPRSKILAMSSSREAQPAALTAGADAFASKGDGPDALLSAVRALLVDDRSGTTVSPWPGDQARSWAPGGGEVSLDGRCSALDRDVDCDQDQVTRATAGQ